jgi:hypothetical protein
MNSDKKYNYQEACQLVKKGQYYLNLNSDDKKKDLNLAIAYFKKANEVAERWYCHEDLIRALLERNNPGDEEEAVKINLEVFNDILKILD